MTNIILEDVFSNPKLKLTVYYYFKFKRKLHLLVTGRANWACENTCIMSSLALEELCHSDIIRVISAEAWRLIIESLRYKLGAWTLKDRNTTINMHYEKCRIQYSDISYWTHREDFDALIILLHFSLYCPKCTTPTQHYVLCDIS